MRIINQYLLFWCELDKTMTGSSPAFHLAKSKHRQENQLDQYHQLFERKQQLLKKRLRPTTVLK